MSRKVTITLVVIILSLLAVVPGQTLWTDRMRSGVGRFSRRPDLAALVVLLVFGAFANAAGMVGLLGRERVLRGMRREIR